MADSQSIQHAPNFKDLVGSKFGMLTVVGFSGCQGGASMWSCHCDCGADCVKRGGNLLHGGTTSCGCKRRRKRGGDLYKRERICWYGIKQRCCNPKDPAYRNYGGRGIEMCEAWQKSFNQFLADMGPKPSREFSIERIDVNGPYSPDNCCWMLMEFQPANKRNSIRIEFHGKTLTLPQWSKELEINYKCLAARLNGGWSVERAFTTQVRPIRPKSSA